MENESLAIAVARMEETQKWQGIEISFLRKDVKDLTKEVKSLLKYKHTSQGKTYVISCVISVLSALLIEVAKAR